MIVRRLESFKAHELNTTVPHGLIRSVSSGTDIVCTLNVQHDVQLCTQKSVKYLGSAIVLINEVPTHHLENWRMFWLNGSTACSSGSDHGFEVELN